MKSDEALCWHGSNDICCDSVPDPTIEDARDVIIKVTACAICGSDLHLMDGMMPTMKSGDVLRHEFMGEVVEVGQGGLAAIAAVAPAAAQVSTAAAAPKPLEDPTAKYPRPGWPEVQRELAPTLLTPAERRLYDATWREFRRDFGLLGGSTRRPAGWAADLRFRQKASLLRVAGTVDFTEDLLDADQQVAVSVAFLETSAALAQALSGRAWRVGQINGRLATEANEETRIAFQTGKLDVVVFTVTESISLHRNEMPGCDRLRSLVVHDMRHSAIQLQQIEGRTHRDGQRATIYYAFGEDTVEERIAATVVSRMVAMHGLAGDDTAVLDELASFLQGEA